MQHIIAFLDRRTGGSRGQGLAEFALVFPVMMLLIFSIFDLGRAIYAWSTISDAARSGSRVAIIDQTSGTDCVATPTTAECVAAKQAVALGIQATSVTVAYRTFDLLGPCNPVAINCVAEVTVPYPFHAATPVIGAIVGVINLSSTTRLPVERLNPPTP